MEFFSSGFFNGFFWTVIPLLFIGWYVRKWWNGKFKYKDYSGFYKEAIEKEKQEDFERRQKLAAKLMKKEDEKEEEDEE